MKNDTIHLVTNEFSRGIRRPLDWWKYRLSIYEHYTLKSIVEQTNKNFYLLVTIDSVFPLVDELKSLLENSGLKYLLVNKAIKNDLKNKLEELPDFEYVFATRIDSDDLFRKDVVEEIQKFEYKWRRALIFQKGYCYDCVNKKLQHYQVSSPPNSTIMFPKEVFLDEIERIKYMNIHGHDQIFSQMNSIVLSENKYIILIHERNRRSIYVEGEQAEKLGRSQIKENEHDEILKDFGINSSTHEKVWKE